MGCSGGAGEGPVSLHRVELLLKGLPGPVGETEAFHGRWRIFSVKTRGPPLSHPGPGLTQVPEHGVPSEVTRASPQVTGSPAENPG